MMGAPNFLGIFGIINMFDVVSSWWFEQKLSCLSKSGWLNSWCEKRIQCWKLHQNRSHHSFMTKSDLRLFTEPTGDESNQRDSIPHFCWTLVQISLVHDVHSYSIRFYSYWPNYGYGPYNSWIQNESTNKIWHMSHVFAIHWAPQFWGSSPYCQLP